MVWSKTGLERLPNRERKIKRMDKNYCDICGKKMQDETVMQYTDPLDYQYGECRIYFDIGLQGIYEVGFGEICHECQQRIANIDMNDFHNMLKRLMGLDVRKENKGNENTKVCAKTS